MFVEVADTTCLRQGDILEGIPFPRLAAGEISILGTISHETPQPHVPRLTAATSTHRDDPSWIAAQVPVRLSYCAIISQCCDLEPRSGRMVIPTFALARLIPIPQSINSDAQRLASLRSNKDPRVGSDPGFINFFHIPSHPRLSGSEWVVDYNQTISVPGREFPAILAKKILQMENDWRVKFKIKLATCLARLTEEERSSGLENPWRAKQEDMKFPPRS
jgi:hypothetical protein